MTFDMLWNLMLLIVGGLNAWLLFARGQDKDDRKTLWQEINAMKAAQAQYMTRPEVKEMMQEALAPIKEEQLKTVNIMRNIEAMLRQIEKEFAVTKYALFNKGRLNESASDDN